MTDDNSHATTPERFTYTLTDEKTGDTHTITGLTAAQALDCSARRLVAYWSPKQHDYSAGDDGELGEHEDITPPEGTPDDQQ